MGSDVAPDIECEEVFGEFFVHLHRDSSAVCIPCDAVDTVRAVEAAYCESIDTTEGCEERPWRRILPLRAVHRK